MPAEIDTGGPRVLHCDPDLVSSDNNEYPDELIESNDGLVKQQKNSRQLWRQNKNRRRDIKKKFNEKLIDYCCEQERATGQTSVIVETGHKISCFCVLKPAKEIDDFVQPQEDIKQVVGDECLGLKVNPAVLKRLQESSHCSCLSTTNKNIVDCNTLDNTWYVDSSEQSVECRFNNNIKNDLTKVNKKWNNRTNSQSKRRSYIQLVFLLFLVVFGHSGMTRSSILEIVTVGTMFGVATRAAPVDSESAIRSERSANLSHVSGTSRKIRLFLKHRFLQITPDGTVNGSGSESDYCKL